MFSVSGDFFYYYSFYQSILRLLLIFEAVPQIQLQ